MREFELAMIVLQAKGAAKYFSRGPRGVVVNLTCLYRYQRHGHDGKNELTLYADKFQVRSRSLIQKIYSLSMSADN